MCRNTLASEILPGFGDRRDCTLCRYGVYEVVLGRHKLHLVVVRLPHELHEAQPFVREFRRRGLEACQIVSAEPSPSGTPEPLDRFQVIRTKPVPGHLLKPLVKGGRAFREYRQEFDDAVDIFNCELSVFDIWAEEPVALHGMREFVLSDKTGDFPRLDLPFEPWLRSVVDVFDEGGQ